METVEHLSSLCLNNIRVPVFMFGSGKWIDLVKYILYRSRTIINTVSCLLLNLYSSYSVKPPSLQSSKFLYNVPCSTLMFITKTHSTTTF